jgi:phage terminase large subunit-like protein
MIDVISNINLDTKRRLNTLLNEQTRRLGLLDLHFFCKHILGYTDLTPKTGFHGEFCEHLENKDNKFKLSLTPRGSLKSSIGTIGHPIQEIIKNPNIRILLASEKFTISTAFLTEIKGHFEKNEKFRALYGNLIGKDKWTGSEITVSTRTRWRKEPTISCAGIDVTKVGMHYDRIKVDDPHSDQNTQSQDQIDKVIRWFKLLFSLLDPGGYLDVNGTIWHYGDLYNYIQNKERERQKKGRKKRFTVFKRTAFTGTQDDLLNDRVTKDKLLWPERLSADFLKDTLIEQGPYIFSCQYLLNPIDDETAVFKRSWIQTCTKLQVPKNLSIYSTVDPMRDEEGKDYLAITTCGMDENWRVYILDVRRLKADEHDTVDEMFKVYKKWNPIKIGFESVAWQKTYYNYVKMLQVMRNIRMPIVQLKTDTKVSKRMRIKSMVPYWKAGLFTIVTNKTLDTLEGNKAVLVDELTRYPKVTNDDCIDALAYINQLTRRPGVLQILNKISPKSFKGIKNRIRKPKNKLGIYNIRGGVHAN